MTDPENLVPGLYDLILDDEINAWLTNNPELRPILAKIDDELAPERFAQFLWNTLRQSLPVCPGNQRQRMINRLIELISATDGLDYLQRKKLFQPPRDSHDHHSAQRLLEICAPNCDQPLPRPETPLWTSTLLTGRADDPQLERELRMEMMSADRVDILISFIKYSGLRLLMPGFENLAKRRVPVRIVTTSYMGASDPQAIEWLAKHPNISLRVSYETERTRLHAKAYQFFRKTGFSTAYIGSANMSKAAMTSGLEWTVKVTACDLPHILQRFAAEFHACWESDEFIPYDLQQQQTFRKAIHLARQPQADSQPRFLIDITPYPFQERILEALAAERERKQHRNLVVAATGTGKTVVAAFDYARWRQQHPAEARLLFVAHRKEILHQARDCFRMVLRDMNFGEMLVDGQQPSDWEAVFASVQSLSRHLPSQRERQHFHYLVLDEAHHGTASSYRLLFDDFRPKILLGLTATPERMDGSSVMADFDGKFAAEIRLPEALEEKLLCPFQYFGVTDPISLAEEKFWRNGRYNERELENIYTGDDLRAKQRVDVIWSRVQHYQPDLEQTRAVGFCVTQKHAQFMAEQFRHLGVKAETILGTTPPSIREQRLQQFRRGEIKFLFTVDVLSEGIDVPEINLVLFLRPTESLTVFLQQLGRGLRHAPGKDCLVVLDFIGQANRKYQVFRKWTALLRSQRRRIDKEIENGFPSVPPGCDIQLERQAAQYILENIRQSLGNLKKFVPESIRTFSAETQLPLTFGNFIHHTDLSPIELLRSRTWTQWKELAQGHATTSYENQSHICKTLRRVALRDSDHDLNALQDWARGEDPSTWNASTQARLYYLLWSKPQAASRATTYAQAIQAWKPDAAALNDLAEIAAWRLSQPTHPTPPLSLPDDPGLELHASYSTAEIKAAFGIATFTRSGPTGVGVIRHPKQKIYLHFITFHKEERDFSPTTRYKDYLISRTKLHWETQSNITQTSPTGRSYLHFKEDGYTILFFARMNKRIDGETAPFLFLGPTKDLLSYQGNRPISMIWELQYPVPAVLYEEAKIN